MPTAALLACLTCLCRQSRSVHMSAADTATGSSLDEETPVQQQQVEEQDSEGSQGSVKHKDPAATAAAVRKQVWAGLAVGGMVWVRGVQ